MQLTEEGFILLIDPGYSPSVHHDGEGAAAVGWSHCIHRREEKMDTPVLS